ncbi:Phage protein [Hyphomicrobiales bacterium]|nr:Phage protein [Hyphomicrobiales bacterium]CAH1671706.1 Phage protein [Hyphomicrobiales bacterium]
MKTPKGQIERTGTINFGDAYLSIWEEGESPAGRRSGLSGEWEKKFKRDVFTRIVQTLNRLGWDCAPPPIKPHDVKHYGGTVARWASQRRRDCRKGDLFGELEISGRTIKLEMWQSVNTPTRPDHGGRYEPNKEAVMPYLLRLEMERTRRRIRDYLCNVFSGYEFRPPKAEIGPDGITALEWIEQNYRESCHYNPKLGRPSGDEYGYNNKSADGGHVEHGARVWFTDWHGRILEGVAYYNINNMWWVVTGKYDRRNVASFEIYTKQPDNLRTKRNGKVRRKRLEAEIAKAVGTMDFERAAILRDILFPGNPALFVVWHKGHCLYHCANFQGYTHDKDKAGRFTAREVKGWNQEPNEVRSLAA